MAQASTRARSTVVLGTAIVTLLLVGCSGEEPPSDAPETGQESAEQPQEDADAPAGAGEDDAASGDAAVLDVDPGAVLVEEAYTLPGTEDEVTVGVLPLEVDDKTMILRLAFTPDFSSASDDELIKVYDMYPRNGMKFRPVLVDRENLKEYSLISDTGQDWVADVLELEAANGETVVWWGVYAAPEDDVDTFDLRLRGSMPEFTDVPLP